MWTVRESTWEPEIYSKAYDWYVEMPGFLKELQKVRGCYDSQQDFQESLEPEYKYVGEENGEAKVLVIGEKHEDGTAEGHLLCEPGTNIGLVAAVVSFAKTQILAERPVIVCHVLRRHKTLFEVMRRSGFRDSGMRSFQGVYRGRLQEVLYFVASADRAER